MKKHAINVKNQVTKHTKYVQEKFKEHASTAIIAAFSFLIAISWKDFIVKLVKENLALTSLEKYPYLAELYSAVIVTILAIMGIAIVSNWAQKPEDKSKK